MSVINVRGVRALALTLFFTLLAFSGQAADRQPPAALPDVVVVIDPLEQSGEAFRQVIADAAEYKLAKLGLAAQIASPSAKDVEPPSPGTSFGAAPVSLVCRYEVNGLEMSVVLRWYDSQNKTITATVQTSGQMDLHLDGIILAAMDQILEKVKDRIQTLTARKVDTAATLPPGQAQTNVSPLEPVTDRRARPRRRQSSPASRRAHGTCCFPEDSRPSCRRVPQRITSASGTFLPSLPATSSRSPAACLEWGSWQGWITFRPPG